MAETAAIAIYNFVNAAALSAGANAALAYKAGHLAVSVAKVAATTALTAAASQIIAAENAAPAQGSLTSITVNPNEPRRLQIGKRVNAGVLMDWYTRGSTNQWIYMIVYLGEGPMGSCTGLYGGGRRVHESLSHGVRTAIPGYRDPDGDRMWVTYYDGRVGQTADAYLVSQGVGYTSNHVAAGCAYAIIEARWDPDNMATPPTDIAFELEGACLYDRRLDSTAGGSGSHRLDNPATWTVSANPAVALDHYLLGRQWNGEKVFGIGLDAEDVPYDRFAALANLCDEDVSRKVSGTYKKYRANGFLFADRTFSNTIKDLCRAMAARPADFGGRVGVLDGESRTSVMTLTEDDLIEGIQDQYTPKRSWSELVSEVNGTYQSPASSYQAVEYPKISNAAWITEDGGTPKPRTVDFEMETDVERAQRLAWLFAKRERRQAQLTGTYKLRAVELEQGDWFVRSGGRFGAGKTFEVINRILDPETFTVTITAFEVDASDSAWAANIATDAPPDPISNADTLAPMEVPTITSVTSNNYSGTAVTLPGIRVVWDSPDDLRAKEILIELIDPSDDVITRKADATRGKLVIIGDVLDDTSYQLRAKFQGDVKDSEWSTVFDIDSNGTYTVGSASTVPWSGVTDDGNRPDDNADVTGDNTAAAITGQGPLATSSLTEDGVNNALSPVGGNFVLDPYFDQFGNAAYWGTDGTAGSVTQAIEATPDGLAVYRVTATGTANGQYRRLRVPHVSNSAKTGMNVQQGDRVGVSALVGQDGGSRPILYIEFRDSAGAWVDGFTSSDTGILAGTGRRDTFSKIELYADAPAGAHYAYWAIRFYGDNGQTFTGRIAEAGMYRMEAGQTIVPSFSPQPGSERGADPTGDNISAGVAGQTEWTTAPYTIAEILAGAYGHTPINPNPYFMDPRSPAVGIPQSWANWVSGTSLEKSSPRAAGAHAAYADAFTGTISSLGVLYDAPTGAASPGKRFKVRFTALRTAGSYNGAGLLIFPRNSAGVALQTLRISCAADPATNGVVSNVHDGVTTWEKIVTMPADTVRYTIYAMWAWSGHAGHGSNHFQGHVLECSATEITEAERRTDTQEDNADETATGSAASIANQGGLATGNYYSQSADPGSVPNGSFWHDTDTDELFMRISNSWQLIANVSTGGGGPQFSVVPNAQYAFGTAVAGGLATINQLSAPSVVVAGGASPYDYDWSVQTLTGASFSISNADQQTPTVTCTPGLNQTSTGRLYCTVTDDDGTKISFAIDIEAVDIGSVGP